MSISIGSKLVGTDISFYTHPLAQVSVGPVVVWESKISTPNALIFTLNQPQSEVVLPISQRSEADYTVNWGDGKTSKNTNSHVYSDSGGVYRAVVTGACDLYTTTKLDDPVKEGFRNALTKLELNGKCPIRGFNTDGSIGYWFEKCTKLKSIPDGLFNGLTVKNEEIYMHGIFRDCSALEAIPEGLFAKIPTGLNIKSLSAMNMFANCSSVQNIPSGFFNNCSSSVSCFDRLDSFFSGCSSLKSIPNGIFAKANVGYLNSSGSKIEICLNGMFSDCIGLNTIPSDIFPPSAKLGKQYALQCRSMFSYCRGLQSIPSTLFNGVNTYGLSLMYMFTSCISLKNLPSIDAMYMTGSDYTDSLQYVSMMCMFYGCVNLQSIPSTFFSKIPNMKDVSFNSLFSYCSGLKGNAPETWKTHSKCSRGDMYHGCKNLSNYSSIPDTDK